MTSLSLPPAPAASPSTSGAPAKPRVSVSDVLILAVVGALILAVIVGFLWFLDRESARQHVEAPVDILLVTPVTFLDGDGDRDVEYDISYRFEADGQLFAGVHTESWHDQRTRRKVCYNPADPGDHSLVSSTVTCGETLLFGP